MRLRGTPTSARGGTEREIIWLRTSWSDLRDMPEDVKEGMGAALRWAQTGGIGPDGKRRLGLHPQAKEMKGDLVEVIEIRDDFEGETYRTMYTAKLGERIYVLHAFQKKSKKGVATPRTDLDLIRQRLGEARAIEERLSAAERNSAR